MMRAAALIAMTHGCSTSYAPTCLVAPPMNRSYLYLELIRKPFLLWSLLTYKFMRVVFLHPPWCTHARKHTKIFLKNLKLCENDHQQMLERHVNFRGQMTSEELYTKETKLLKMYVHCLTEIWNFVFFVQFSSDVIWPPNIASISNICWWSFPQSFRFFQNVLVRFYCVGASRWGSATTFPSAI